MMGCFAEVRGVFLEQGNVAPVYSAMKLKLTKAASCIGRLSKSIMLRRVVYRLLTSDECEQLLSRSALACRPLLHVVRVQGSFLE